MLAEVINFNPYQYENEGHTWIELAAAVTSALSEDGVEISVRCAREKVNLMLHQFHVEDHKNLQKYLGFFGCYSKIT